MRIGKLWRPCAFVGATVGASLGVTGAAPAQRAPALVLRVAFAGTFLSVDPAVSTNPYLAQIQYSACTKLLNFPDAAGARGTRLVPEVARSLPSISRDRRTYTFRLRGEFRFSDGSRVTAHTFADAINRLLRPGIRSPAAQYFADVVGADDVVAGRAATARGIRVVRGNRLEIQLKRPAPDFPARLATHYACAVPAGYSPNAPAEVPAAGSGPYYIAAFDPSRTLILKRNKYYRGTRPRRFSEIVWLLNTPGDAVHLQVERGEAEVGYPSPAANRELVKRYGLNRRRFFVAPSLRVVMLVLNTERRLFRRNPRLRRAVNFAVDRRALVSEFGGIAGRRTDQYLSPAMPGFRDAAIYPTKRPNLRRAAALARGHTRGGTAIMYTANASQTAQARAHLVRASLQMIGIDVEVRVIGGTLPPAMFTREAPYDIWDRPVQGGDYPDPAAALNPNFSGAALRPAQNTNLSFFDEPRWTRRLEAAAKIAPPRRYRVYGRLDVALARDVAPAVAYAAANSIAFVADGIGCVVMTPVYGLDLGAVCRRA